MIIKPPLPEDQIPVDAPPSYNAAESDTASTSYLPDEKSPIPLTLPSSQSPVKRSSGPSGASRNSTKSKGPAAWFSFGVSRTTKEVHATVLGLVRDLVKQHYSAPGASGILDSCAEACDAYDLSFSSILQEMSIENHTPIHWAIVKRPSEPPNPDDHDLVTALLSRSAPLQPSTISDIRLACLLTSDQALFQRLRLSPVFSPMSGTDEILLGASIPPDVIAVEHVEGDTGAFVANFEILAFQKRMRVSNRINLEFIARGRMWSLSFSITSSSQWVVTMAILEHSPSTWIDSRLIIEEPPQHSAPAEPTSHWLIDAAIPDESSTSSRSQANKKRSKPKPNISLRLKSGNQQLTPFVSDAAVRSEIVVALEDSMMGPSLQYDGSSYVDAEGALRARLEARLAKPEAECVIC